MSETESAFAPVGVDSSPSPTAGSSGERPTGRRSSDRIVGASRNTQQVIDQVGAAARSDLHVLIVGPAGAGKGHVARAVHAWSPRASHDLTVLQLTAVSDSSLEEELFGAVSPSRTLASGTNAGALEAAMGSTLLIQRIDLLPDAVRGSLVDALTRGGFRRVGQVDGEAIPIRARIVATAPDGDESLLGGLPAQVIEISPLAQRQEDILPLAAHFLAEVTRENGLDPVGFTADARRLLLEEVWGANVRELRERIRLAINLSGHGAVSAEALMLSNEGDDVPSFKEAKRAFETRYVEGLLRRCNGNISRAARLAKKDRKDFYDVIRRTGVDPSAFRP